MGRTSTNCILAGLTRHAAGPALSPSRLRPPSQTTMNTSQGLRTEYNSMSLSMEFWTKHLPQTASGYINTQAQHCGSLPGPFRDSSINNLTALHTSPRTALGWKFKTLFFSFSLHTLSRAAISCHFPTPNVLAITNVTIAIKWHSRVTH